MLAYGEEVGRIVGYQGSDLFWMQLEQLAAKAGFVPVGRWPTEVAGSNWPLARVHRQGRKREVTTCTLRAGILRSWSVPPVQVRPL
jgi:hypothetical protein